MVYALSCLNNTHGWKKVTELFGNWYKFDQCQTFSNVKPSWIKGGFLQNLMPYINDFMVIY